MTTASSRASSKRLALAAVALAVSALAVVALAACTSEEPGLTGTTSLRVEITAPADLGSEDMRLGDGDRNVTLAITALDQDGNPDTSLDAPVDLYVHFLGTLSPERGTDAPLTTLDLTDGVAVVTVPLPVAYGRTLVWVEDATREGATFATGVSNEVWFRDPFLEDVSRPFDETSLSALEHSPLEGKQVKVGASYFGAGGNLVVTGVYAQGYTVSDVEAASKATRPYGHAFIFTFGRPRAEDFREIQVGHLVRDVSGGLSEFNGLTEITFPATNLVEGAADPARVPAPAVLDPDWLLTPTGPTGMINLERLESALVAVDGGTVCPLDDDFEMYGQWKLNVGFGCNKPMNVVTKGQVSDFDPTPLVGQTIPRVVGTLRAVNIGTFHVWIVQPRSSADIQTN